MATYARNSHKPFQHLLPSVHPHKASGTSAGAYSVHLALAARHDSVNHINLERSEKPGDTHIIHSAYELGI